MPKRATSLIYRPPVEVTAHNAARRRISFNARPSSRAGSLGQFPADGIGIEVGDDVRRHARTRLRCLFDLGLRRNEVITLDLADVDRRTGTSSWLGAPHSFTRINDNFCCRDKALIAASRLKAKLRLAWASW